MLASLDEDEAGNPLYPGAAASSTTGSTASTSWTDVGKTAVLDVLHALTGGNVGNALANKAASLINPGGASAANAAAAQRAAADNKNTMLIFAGVAGVVVLGAVLLMRRK